MDEMDVEGCWRIGADLEYRHTPYNPAALDKEPMADTTTVDLPLFRR
jgi:hypothetical protein